MSPPPPAFVAEQAVGPQSVGSRLTLRSATTGEVVRGLGTFGQAFTNNGLAVTGNLAQVFYTLTPVRSSRHGNGLRVMRLDVASGRRSFIATGSEPALSPDDNQLAYGAYPNGLTVRDLETGRTRTVSLTRQLGAVANLTLTSITWLAGENEVAFVAPARAIATAGRAHGRPATGSCHAADGSTLVFVTVPPAPERLRAHCVTVPGLDSVEADLSASPTGSDVVRVASLAGDGFTIRDVTTAGTIRPVLALTPGLPVAFDPAGDRLLYLRGHPPALWSAQIRSGRLTERHRLIADSQLGAAAW